MCIDKDKDCIGKNIEFFYHINKQTKKIEHFQKHKIKGVASICLIYVPVVSYLSNKYKLSSLDIKQQKF